MGLNTTEYVPVLKAKDAEIAAALASPHALTMTPVFEVQQAPLATKDPRTGLPKKTKSAATDAAHFLDEIGRVWNKSFYVDIGRVATTPTDRKMWWDLLALLNRLAPTPVALVPVVSTDDDPASRASAGSMAALGRAALRVPMQLVRLNPSVLNGMVPLVAAEMNIGTADLDVILDWSNDLEAQPLDALTNTTMAAISALGDTHGRVITVGTPDDSGFTQVGDWDPVRREWWLWLRLAHAGVDVVFGDYALYAPSDPGFGRAQYGHLRYSSSDRIYVHRRAVPATGGGLAGAFRSACAYLVTQSHWLGSGFCDADQRIDKIAKGLETCGSAKLWRQIGMEHHFALVAQQLAAPPSAPPSGTP